MRQLLILLFLVITFPFAAHAEPTDEAVRAVMKNAINDFVRPGYRKLHDASNDIGADVNALCENPGVETLAEAREGFSDLARSWAEIEVIRFGPVSEENRFERTLFYPDRKSTGLKQVQRILAKKDESAVDADRLSGKSVAVQGLGALEFLLSGTGADSLVSGDPFRCAYAQAITRNLQQISLELLDGWSDESAAMKLWTQPGPENPILREPREAVNELLGTLVHGLETIRDIRIGAFLKSESKKDRPRVALFRRSENTLLVTNANMLALKELLLKSGITTMLEEQDRALVDNVVFELQNAQRVLSGIEEPIADALANPESRNKLVYLKTSVSFAIGMLDEDIARAAGLSSGFSFSDGD